MILADWDIKDMPVALWSTKVKWIGHKGKRSTVQWSDYSNGALSLV